MFPKIITLSLRTLIYFYFRKSGKYLIIRHFPNRTTSEERNIKIENNSGDDNLLIIQYADKWLKLIEETRTYTEKWDNLFNNKSDTNDEYVPYEDIEGESALDEQSVKNFILFLSAFNDRIQNSSSLPPETKDAFNDFKEQAVKELKDKPQKKTLKFIGKLFYDLSFKYLTTPEFREEVNLYFNKAKELVSENLGQISNWLDSLK